MIHKLYQSVTRRTRACGKQEMSANAHETRDSISVISYAGCLSSVISAKVTLSVRRSLKWRKNH